jgi:hypothetical protein
MSAFRDRTQDVTLRRLVSQLRLAFLDEVEFFDPGFKGRWLDVEKRRSTV